MRDIDTLITTLGAFQRLKLVANESKPDWKEEEYGSLLLGLHSEVYELLAEIASPQATVESIWCEAADVANLAAMIASHVAERKRRESIGAEFNK